MTTIKFRQAVLRYYDGITNAPHSPALPLSSRLVLSRFDVLICVWVRSSNLRAENNNNNKKMNKYKREIQTKEKPLQNKMPLNKVNRCTNTKI